MKPVNKKEQLKYRTYYFSINMIKFIESVSVNRSLTDQLLRSSTSIGANIAEAQAASSRKDFTNYYAIALKSANETKYWLGLFRDGIGINRNVIEPLLVQCNELSNMIGASLLTLRNKR